jgi:L-threonylcarbamoyladenylate synthase
VSTEKISSDIQGQITRAAELLAAGDVVGMPTETVYGLAARIDSEEALKKVFAVKERPFFDPLIVHVNSIEAAKKYSKDWNECCQLLAERFWPGPLTLVVPKTSEISDLITSGLPSVGLRWPKHPVAQALLEAAGAPLAAPSANKFGRTSPTTAAHVRREFGDSLFVIEGSASDIGIESSVVGLKQNGSSFELSMLRKGAVLQSDIDQLLKEKNISYQWVEVTGKSEAPGRMKHHYMPSVPLVICKNPRLTMAEISQKLKERLASMPDEVEGVKIIKPKSDLTKLLILNLSSKPEQAARELYAQLRSVSDRKPDAMCFIQSSAHTGEMWESILDRLYKAASLILD